MVDDVFMNEIEDSRDDNYYLHDCEEDPRKLARRKAFNLPNKDELGRQTPKGGWVERCWYLVKVSHRKSNPVHEALLYTGFLDVEGQPGGYSFVMASNGGDKNPVDSALYLEPIKELHRVEI